MRITFRKAFVPRVAVLVLAVTASVRAQVSQTFLDDFSDGSITDDSPVSWVRGQPPLHTGLMEVVDDALVLEALMDVEMFPGAYETDWLVEDWVSHDVTIRIKFRALPDADGRVDWVGVFALDPAEIDQTTGKVTGADGVNFYGLLHSDGRIRIGNLSRRGTTVGDAAVSQQGSTLRLNDNNDMYLKFAIEEKDISLSVWEEGTLETEAPVVRARLARPYWEQQGRVGIFVGSERIGGRAAAPAPVSFDYVGVGTQLPQLRAGDANQDLQFDQFDVVRVMQAGKYLAGGRATWQEGDWNGAPGGFPGKPPAGDGVFDQLDIVAALATNLYFAGPYAATAAGGTKDAGGTPMKDVQATGDVAVGGSSGVQLKSINVGPAYGTFTGDPAQILGGNSGNDGDNNIFKAIFDTSFGSLGLANSAQPRLSQDDIVNDVLATGSLAAGGALGNVDLIYVPVPEPSAYVLSFVAILGAAAITTRRRR